MGRRGSASPTIKRKSRDLHPGFFDFQISSCD
jgi:hypothetical protein